MIFIRPWMLLLILAWPLLVLARKKVQPDNPWKRIVDAVFLPYLMEKTGAKTIKRNRWFIGVLWTALCVAAAGPSFEKIQADSVTRSPDTVIVADLSPAVNGAVLAQLRVKLYELLTALKGDNVGLVLYDTKGYVVAPLTPDTMILRDMVPVLAPDVLPEVADNPVAGFEKAAELLGPDNKNGRIIFVTAGGFDEKSLAVLARHLPYQVGVLGIGSETTGVPMPLKSGGFVRGADGQPILAKADADRLSVIGTYRFARPDGSEIPELLRSTETQSTGVFDGEETAFKADVWRDLGVYIVVICLPFVALLFRKGVFFVLLLFWGLGGQAAWFERPDQTAYKQDVRGVDAYRSGDYKQATELFSHPYNQGNALAYQGLYQDAIASYEKALEENPNHADALFNKKYLEQQLQQNKQSDGGEGQSQSDETQQSEQSQSQGESQNNEQSGQSDKQGEQSGDKSDEKQQSDNMTNESGDDETQSASQPQSDTQSAGEETATAESEPQGNQQTQQLFNRLKKDPARVLKYRINRQHLRFFRQNK